MRPSDRPVARVAWLAALAAAAGCSFSNPQENWRQNAQSLRAQRGRRFFIDCGANGTLRPIWGADVYTDDSSICTAAVHAGVITRTSGGEVIFEIVQGPESYCALSRNGVTSQRYGVWEWAFRFPAATGQGTPATCLGP